MKKRILLTIGAAFAVTAAMAQAPVKSMEGQTIKRMAGEKPAAFNGNKSTTDNYRFDYDEAELQLGSFLEGLIPITLQDRRDTTSVYNESKSASRARYSVVSKFADLTIFDSDANMIIGDYANVQSLKVDSVWFFMSLEKVTPSSVKDSIKISLIPVDNGGYPDITATPIAVQYKEYTASTPNAATSVVMESVDFGGVTIPNKKFAVRFQYMGDKADTLMLAYYYPHDETPCLINNQSQSFFAPVAGAFYPQSYYTVNWGADTVNLNPLEIYYDTESALFPLGPQYQSPGAFVWYIGCNGITTANTAATNMFQYLAVYPYITLEHSIGVQDMDAKSIAVTNYPNPAADFTTVEFSTVNEGNATLKVTDLTGKQIANYNLGKVVNGVNKFDLNTSNYSAGVYVYTLNVDGIQVTKKFVVTK